jgi:serine/threonine protein kinase
VTSRWETIFDQLVEESAEVRQARLDELAVNEPELARFVARLLAADRTEEGLVGTPILAASPVFVAAALESGVAMAEALTTDLSDGGGAAGRPGAPPQRPSQETIGPYRLVRCLGEGGMGEVFLAERSDGEFEQRVALKRIRAGLDSRAIAERFLRERQILARLDHPGIAHLLDGGSTEEGDPYFVLEHVEGEPITQWCARRAASLETRLGLMIEVADAVDAAHRQLVVHRDLKPTNILVTAGGRVKLLDFGIAKLLQAEAFDERQTQLGGQPLTPAYAAPEQILGEAVTTATDVYSMGALLFELLTGRPPFDRGGRPLPALARAVDSETLERPSVVAAAADDLEPERETLRGFASRLSGDLDTIVLKALNRDPARRYPSAAAFGDDLRRFLAGRPVAAQPDSAAYRMRRFIGRHSLAVASGLVGVAALVAGVGVVLWQAGVARGEARRADRVKSFLIELFREADPSQTLGETISAREILEKGARRLDLELADEPALRAELLDAVAQVERNLGLLDAAAGRADAAIALRRGAAEGAPRDLAASLVTRAEIHFDHGDLVPARASLEEALRLAPELATFASPLARRFSEARFAVLGQQLDVAEAEALGRRALAAELARPESDPLEAAHWRLGLAGLLIDASRVTEGEPFVRAALPALAETKGKNPLRVATARLQAGEMLDVLGDDEEAARWLVSGLELYRSVLGADHPEVALWEIKLGYYWSENRRFDEAESVLQHAVKILRGIGHYDAGSAMRYLGFVSQGRGQFDVAYERFVEAERIFRDTLGEDGPLQRAARSSQGSALARAGRFAEAKPLLERMVEETERIDGPQSLPLRAALKPLGEVERELGRPERALELHRRALEIERKVFGRDDHLGIAASRFQLALDHAAVAERGDAASWSAAAEEIARAISVARQLDPAAPRLAEYLQASARIALGGGDAATARRDLTEALARFRAQDGPGHPRTAAAERELAALDPPRGPAAKAVRIGPSP